jgi:hypothetical protein
MDFRKSLQFAFSDKERAEKILANLNSVQISSKEDEIFSNKKKKEYLELLEQSKKEIIDLNNQIDKEIDTKKYGLYQHQSEFKKLNTRLKIGEINLEDCEKAKTRIKKEYDRIKKEVIVLKELKTASSSEDVGGYKERKQKGINEDMVYANINKLKGALQDFWKDTSKIEIGLTGIKFEKK